MFSAISIGDSLQQGLDAFFAFIPNLIGFLVILVVGWIIAKVVRTVINKALDKVGVDKALHNSDTGKYVERVSPGAKPSHLIGAVAYWFIFLFAVSAAIAALKIPALTTFIAQVQAFLPNVIVAVLIFVVSAALAGGAAAMIQKLMGDTSTGKIARAVAPGLILAIGTFMMLNQLQIAPAIVTITYASIMALLVLAGGLAFGLGGRDVAADMLRDAYRSGKDNKDDVRRDVQQGRERAERKAEEAKSQAPTRTNETTQLSR